jgi:hypothetical protein
VISRHQLEAALMIQKQTRARLGITLISQGFLSEDALVTHLAEALSVPRVALSTLNPEWAAVHLLRARFCELNEVFPFAVDGKGAARKALLVAMADPLNAPAIQEIEFTTGLPVGVHIATLSEVRNAILRYYHKVDAASAEGKISLAQAAAAAARPTELNVPAVGAEEPIVMGQELPPEPAPQDARALEQLITQRAQAAQKKKATLSKDLDYLFGAKHEPDELEKLERKFWALMRIMARKGLITKDEFRQELDEGEG